MISKKLRVQLGLMAIAGVLFLVGLLSWTWQLTALASALFLVSSYIGFWGRL